MTTVLICDDQELVRTGFHLILDLEEDIDVVGEVADGKACLTAVARLRPDVVLMDIRMPVMDGIAATRVIAETGFGTKVLVLTTFDLDEYVYDAMRAGASGFLLKDAPREQLSAREREVFGLVAQGLSNSEIATDLVVGEATVKTHVANVLAKLALRDRVQAVVLAYETGFVQPGRSHGRAR